MATKKVAAFTAGLPDEPDYEDLLNKRQKVTPIKGDPLTVNATRQAQYFDTVATGQGLGDKRSDVAENLSQLGTNSAINRDMSSSQFNNALATRRATEDQHNNQVELLKEYDAKVAAAEAAAAEAAKGKAQWGFEQNGSTSIDFSQYKQGEAGNGSVSVGTKVSFIDHNGRRGVMTLNAHQAANANKIIAIGKKRGFNAKDIQTALAVAMDESKLTNVTGGDRDSGGLYQQRPSQGWGTYAQVRNTDYAINKFYTELTKLGGSQKDAGWVRGQRVQRSAWNNSWNYGLNYKGMWDGAGKILSASINPVGYEANTATPKSLQSFIKQNEGKYTMENSAFGTQCVALFKKYLGSLGLNPKIGVGGSAKYIWGLPYMDANFKRVSRTGAPKAGDIAVFGANSYNKHGHVGIVVSSTATTVTLFNSHSGGKKTDFTTMNKSTLKGYYRR